MGANVILSAAKDLDFYTSSEGIKRRVFLILAR
jgi:hypothetical protein